MRRLHPSTLGDTDASVQLPAYDRARVRLGIAHLGLGAFCKAHIAVYTDDAIARGGNDWGIVGISMRRADVSQQLMPQDRLYSVMSEDAAGRQLRVVGAIRRVLVAAENPAAAAAAIAWRDIRILTLTITEKGYCLGPDGNSLERTDAGIRHDLANPENPSTAVGLVALGLRERLKSGAGPLTILSCDNLSGNSKRLRAVLVDYLGECFPEVLPWMEREITFPCSMVDRIVPAMTASKIQRQSQFLGCIDEGAVSTEPFSQWIIEDQFAAGKPDWTGAGAQLVPDILPYETIKLRSLNASHSAIAYCGLLAGLATVDAVMADATCNQFVQQLMSEDLIPALVVPHGFDLFSYRDQLLARFANPCLAHRCQQIAMDGSEKIRQRWVPTLQVAGAPPVHLLKALSSWCYFILHTDLPIDDPRGDHLRLIRAQGTEAQTVLPKLLECAGITPQTIPDFAALCAAITRNLEVIRTAGMAGLLKLQSTTSGEYL